MSRSYTSSPPSASMACRGTALLTICIDRLKWGDMVRIDEVHAKRKSMGELVTGNFYWVVSYKTSQVMRSFIYCESTSEF
jgi:hypothetical protein